MTGMGSGNYNVQGRAAAETGGGDPSMTPKGDDKRVVMLSLIGIAVVVAAILIIRAI